MTYYIDLGSSTIKVYSYQKELVLEEEHSIHFKDNFSSDKGLAPHILKELCTYFNKIKQKYKLVYENTNIYATGIFRKLNQTKKQELVKMFNDQFDFHLNIISHGLENYYLGCAMNNNYNNKKVLIINMGGKTTEIVTFENNQITKRDNLDVGVGDVLNSFNNINQKYSQDKIEDIEKFVEEKIDQITLDSDYDCALFTGGEERFELLTNFKLIPNTLFNDGIHKYMISIDNYIKDTKRIFYKTTMENLYSLMPNNPKWMDGARAGAVLPLVIFKRANIKWIIPSDLNLINGVINDNYNN